MNQYKTVGHHAVTAVSHQEAATVIAHRNATKLYGKGQYVLTSVRMQFGRGQTQTWSAGIEAGGQSANINFETTEL